MDMSIYKLAGAMKAEEMFLNVVASNIANVSSIGFKRQKPYFHEIYSEEKSKISKVCGSITDFSQGQIVETKNPNDLVIKGDGFLILENGENEFYTKGIKIFVNKEGYLIDENGYFLIGEKGKIKINGEFYISEDGNIYDRNRIFIDKLKIYSFVNKSLLYPIGKSYFKNEGGSLNIKAPENSTVLQGFTEYSNVNIVEEMINLINISRIYEAIQKNIQSLDYLYEKLIGTIR